ncbi:MAG: GNAT family N-acetyltransferase [Candidatus Odinarchaeota archaeon]
MKHFSDKKIVLKNGLEILIRPLKYTDKKELLKFYSELSDKSRRQLFQNHRPVETWRTVRVKTASLYTDGLAVDFKKSYSLVAVIGEGDVFKIIGDGRFFIDRSTMRAELYLVVHENYRNKGVGTKLMDEMLQVLKQLKVKEVYCYINSDNLHMIRLIEKYDFNQENIDGVYLFWKRL